MTDSPRPPGEPADEPLDELADLVDGYLSGALDEGQFRRLEQWLLDDEAARGYFVRYCGTHTDLHVEARARRAAERAVGAITELTPRTAVPASGTPALHNPRRLWKALAAVAAVIVAAVSATWWAATRTSRPAEVPDVAWLANAQDCRWADDGGPGNGLTKGRVLRLERGLAEVRFRSGSMVVLQGPAALELLSDNSARLLNGRLSARVPQPAKGFQVLAPQGRVVDLGTEFGLAVSADGSADVVVFEGKVEAYGGGGPATALSPSRTARIGSAGVVVDPGDRRPDANLFTRQIRPPAEVVPRAMLLDFRRPVAGSLKDVGGEGTGLEVRLPGTGSLLLERDPNLRLDAAAGLLELITTRSDLNTQFRLDDGEYLGVRLSKLGFTGREDFEVAAVLPNIPSLAAVGQFGLYAGARSDRVIRGGLISKPQPDQYVQFLVNNDGGKDHDSLYVGLFPTGSDVRLCLRRAGGKYSMSVESLLSGSASTLSIRHPVFLDAEKDLYVGLFAANTGSEERRKLVVKEFRATVWTAGQAREKGHPQP